MIWDSANGTDNRYREWIKRREEMKKIIKRVISIVLALAMVVTSLSYTPNTVKAATSSITTPEGVIYTVEDPTAGVPGIVFQGAVANTQFNFAWENSDNISRTLTVNVKQGDTEVLNLGEKTNGDGITIAELAGLSNGTYQIVLTGTGAFTDKVSASTLTVQGAKDIDPDNPVSTTIPTLTAPSDVYLYDMRQKNGKFVVKFTDNDADMQVVDGDYKRFKVIVNNTEVGEVTASGGEIDAAAIEALDLPDGTVMCYVREFLTRTNDIGNREELASTPSGYNFFVYNKEAITPVTVNGADTGVAKVFVTTTRGDDATHEWNLLESGIKLDVPASIIIKDADGNVNAADTGSIKLRGNSTSSAQKKPYNIKFASKLDVLGMGKAKK